MSFLSRQRSLQVAPPAEQVFQFPSKHTAVAAAAKPLPNLPFDPIENVAVAAAPNVLRKQSQNAKPHVDYTPVEGHPTKSSTVTGRRGLIRRVSSIFRASPKRKPQQFQLNATPEQQPVSSAHPPSAFAAYTYSSNMYSSQESFSESLDDIRRPSGLGRAASFSSRRSMPHTPVSPKAFPSGNEKEESPKDGELQKLVRSRSVSTPNLLRSLSLKAKNRIRSTKRLSISQPATEPAPIAPAPTQDLQVLPPASPPPRGADPTTLPVEVVEIVFGHLPRGEIPRLARLSRVFSVAARTRLYQRLDLGQLSAKQLEKLLGVLATKRDLTELVQHFTCTAWPSFFNAGRYSSAVPASASSPDRDNQLRNTLLMATFTLALQRMPNLTHITFPSFDLSLLSQHSAFGLKSITFLNASILPEEMTSLLTWLDGQINIAELRFPNLEDQKAEPLAWPTEVPSTPTPVPIKVDSPTYYLSTPPTGPTLPDTSQSRTPFTESNPYLKVSPMSTPQPSPYRQSFHLKVPQAAASSTSLVPPSVVFDPATLLPMVTTLQVTPALLSHLVPPPPADPSSSTPRGLDRPLLRQVSLNINTNLYDGLRPSAVMSCLKGINHLSLRFTDAIDRRTVDKVLTAVSSVLGGQGSEGTETEDGLETFEIGFKLNPGATLSRKMEETVYRSLSSTMARYVRLRNLQLDFLPHQRAPKPLPLSPLNIDVANDKGKKLNVVVATPEALSMRGPEKALPDANIGSEPASLNSFQFPMPPATPSVLPFPSFGPSSPINDGQSKRFSVRGTSQPLSRAESSDGHTSDSPVSKLELERRRKGFARVDSDHLTSQEQARIESWVRQCPSLRRVSLSGMTWYNPLWLPAFRDSTSDLLTRIESMASSTTSL